MSTWIKCSLSKPVDKQDIRGRKEGGGLFLGYRLGEEWFVSVWGSGDILIKQEVVEWQKR